MSIEHSIVFQHLPSKAWGKLRGLQPWTDRCGGPANAAPSSLVPGTGNQCRVSSLTTMSSRLSLLSERSSSIRVGVGRPDSEATAERRLLGLNASTQRGDRWP